MDQPSMENVLRLLRSGTPPVPEFRDGADVKHVCPECGGRFADHLHATIFVQTCWACHGVGTLTDDQLTAYERQSRATGTGLDIR